MPSPADSLSPRSRPHPVLIARLGVAYLLFAGLKHVVALPRLARWAWRCPANGADVDAQEAALRGMVRLRRWFGSERGDCLHGSLTLYRMLSRAGADPRLVVGLRHAQGRVEGHAWVEVGGRAVLETDPRTAGYRASCAFGNDGRLVTDLAQLE